jgi:hypothetical protein
MKTSLLALGASLLFTTVAVADDTHEADRGLEGSLRTAINERHVHIEVHKGIVTLEGKVGTQADRDRIEALVRNTAGVAAIKDKLHVTMPTPGVYGANPSTVPVYATPPPAVAPPATIVTQPPPVVVPEYPKLRIRTSSSEDEPIAHAIAHQLRADSLPALGLENVSLSIMNGTVSLQGFVTSREQHDAVIAAIQRAGGVTAIYDQLQIGGR